MTCKEPGCGRVSHARGLCAAHYQKQLRAGLGPLVEDRRGGRRGPLRGTTRHFDLMAPFGGIRAFCRATGIHTAQVYRWPDGAIPAARHAEIVEGAARSGADVQAVRAALGGVE